MYYSTSLLVLYFTINERGHNMTFVTCFNQLSASDARIAFSYAAVINTARTSSSLSRMTSHIFTIQCFGLLN